MVAAGSALIAASANAHRGCIGTEGHAQDAYGDLERGMVTSTDFFFSCFFFFLFWWRAGGGSAGQRQAGDGSNIPPTVVSEEKGHYEFPAARLAPGRYTI